MQRWGGAIQAFSQILVTHGRLSPAPCHRLHLPERPSELQAALVQARAGDGTAGPGRQSVLADIKGQLELGWPALAREFSPWCPGTVAGHGDSSAESDASLSPLLSLWPPTDHCRGLTLAGS